MRISHFSDMEKPEVFPLVDIFLNLSGNGSASMDCANIPLESEFEELIRDQ